MIFPKQYSKIPNVRTKQAFPGQEGAGLSRLEYLAASVIGGLLANGVGTNDAVRIAFETAKEMEVEADRIQKERGECERND